MNHRLTNSTNSNSNNRNGNNSKEGFYMAATCAQSFNKHMKNNTTTTTTTAGANGFLPMSGSEPPYEPALWNTNYMDRVNHNCYAYFLDNFIPGRPKRPQPGHRNINEKVFVNENFTRDEITRRAISDNPAIYCTDPNKACQKGYYKGVLVIDRYNNYHWLRQDSNGYWSHKPGEMPVTNVDADGKLIKHPGKANLLYKATDPKDSLLYRDVGPYFCIPSKRDTNIKLEAHSCEQCGGGKGKGAVKNCHCGRKFVI